MNPLKCLIVDDEELARTLLTKFIGRLPHLELVGQCKNPLEAMAALREHAVDLMFLDIQMPEMTGVEFLKTLTHKPAVIFTTAYPDYAIEGYQLDVIDYLLKPFSFERFAQAVNKAAEWIHLRAAAGDRPPDKDYLLVKSEHKVHKLSFDEIHYIEGMREYVAFHTPQGRILSLLSLKSLEEELPADRFIRIHKSYIVAIDRVKALEGNRVVLGPGGVVGEEHQPRHTNRGHQPRHNDKGSIKLPIGASYKEEVVRRVFGG